MQCREVFTQLLGIGEPWFVSQVDLALKDREVRVTVDLDESAILVCPACGATCPGYDRRERRWRHLDTMQYETWVIAQVPRLKCPTHGIMQISVPWAEDRSRFTAMFEALVIDWLQEASVSSVTRQLRLTWDQVAGIQARAVARGLARRTLAPPKTRAHLPDADEKIVFDKFHIAKHLGDAVDKVRRQEHRELMRQGSGQLKGSKYLWLKDPERLTPDHKARFRGLRQSGLKVARAWALKDLAMGLWDYVQRGWAERMWDRWYNSAIRCRLEPIKQVARKPCLCRSPPGQWPPRTAHARVGAAMATFAAMPAGYAAQHPDELLWAAGTTYLKLSCAVIGIRWGRSFARARSMRD